MARRLWARFELLPFRYGAALGAGVVVLAGALVLAVTLGGGGPKRAPAPGARPSQRPAEAAAPPAPPTWGAYVPPRRTRSTTVSVRPRMTSSVPRATPTHASPRPTVSCPPTLKKWTWVWEMCHRRPNG